MKKIIALIISTIIFSSFVSCNTTNKPINGIVGNPNSIDKKPQMYQVSFNTNGGSYIEPETTNVLKSASSPYKNGYEFMGWYLDQQLTQSVVFPLEVTYNRTLYAKWLKTEKIERISNGSIKNWADCSPMIGVDLTGDGFDITTLSELGYKIKINVKFESYYTKDYNTLWDIGYAGAPIYRYSLQKKDGAGIHETDNYCSIYAQERTITQTVDASFFKNEYLQLVFSTENMQNTVYIQNIEITYKCIK